MNAPLVVSPVDLTVQDTCFEGYLEIYFVSELANPQELYDMIPDIMKLLFRDIVLQYLNILERKDLKSVCKKLIVLTEQELDNASDRSDKEKIALLLCLNNTRTIKINL